MRGGAAGRVDSQLQAPVLMQERSDAKAAAGCRSVPRRIAQTREDSRIQFKTVETPDVGDSRAADVKAGLRRRGRRDKGKNQNGSKPCEKRRGVHGCQRSMYN